MTGGKPLLSGLSFLICSLQSSDSTCCSPKVFPGDIWSRATCLERFLFLGPPWDQPGPGSGWGWREDSAREGPCVALMWLHGSAPLIVPYQEEQGHHRSETIAECACSLTDPVWVAVGVRRVCWDPVPTNPGFPLASPDCVPFPVKGRGRDQADP